MADQGKKKYKNNYLTQVILQLRFNPIDSIDEVKMRLLKDKLGADYSELATVKHQGLIIQNDGSNISTETEDTMIWELESIDKSHTIIVEADNFAIKVLKYTKFRDLTQILLNAISMLEEVFPEINQINRLGLRYVNQIKLKPTKVKWSEYLNSQLTDSFEFVEEEKLRRSMHSLVIAYDEDTSLNIQYGIFNQYFPSPIVENEFILDIDAFTPYAVEIKDSPKLIEKFNKIIAIYFEKSIKEKLRSEMETIDE